MEKKIKQILAEHVGVEPTDIEDSALLVEDLDLHPAAMTDILEVFRETLDVDIPYNEAADIMTVSELVHLAEVYSKDET